jgi:hypothetical protein
MSIRLQYAGVHIECETPQEAVSIIRLLGDLPERNGHAAPAPAPRVAPIPTNADTPSITSIVRRLGDNQKRLLRLVLEAGGEMDDAQLRRGLGLEGSAFGGTLATITKESRRLGLDSQRFFTITNSRNAAKERVRHYRIPGNAIAEVREGLRE